MYSKRLVKLFGLTVLAAISVMAVSVSAAQAKFLLLLNGKSVSSISFKLEILSAYLKAENGLKIQCSGGTGESKAGLSESGKKLTGAASATFTGCIWVGSEKTCSVNDGGVGQIKIKGVDEMAMPDASTYRLTSTSSEFTTILTEGVFCTIPEEEVVSGTASSTILNALEDTKVKLAHFKADALSCGSSKAAELVADMHVSHAGDSSATFGIHLVEL